MYSSPTTHSAPVARRWSWKRDPRLEASLMQNTRGIAELPGVAVVGGCGYRLTPLQEGMLYPNLSRNGSGTAVEQVVCTLREPLDVPHLARAWQLVADRHQALRAGFRWQGLEQPLQAFRASVAIDVDEHDWRVLGER